MLHITCKNLEHTSWVLVRCVGAGVITTAQSHFKAHFTGEPVFRLYPDSYLICSVSKDFYDVEFLPTKPSHK